VLEAVLFDWGDTLMEFVWDMELIAAGQRAGLRAIGADRLAEDDAFVDPEARFAAITALFEGTLDEIDYPGFVRNVLEDAGVVVDQEQLDRFLEAEHAAWDPARVLARDAHALLEALRGRGLKLGLVSNAFDPGWLLHRDLEEFGVAERLDFAVFSSEVGKRKPHPEIFERALDALGVESGRAMFVGDRLYEDVRGSGELGMTTVQAVWFRADEHPDGREPDHQAFTMMDVLNVADRLVRA
jgi:putative hydrolase of the HAD superfamily